MIDDPIQFWFGPYFGATMAAIIYAFLFMQDVESPADAGAQKLADGAFISFCCTVLTFKLPPPLSCHAAPAPVAAFTGSSGGDGAPSQEWR